MATYEYICEDKHVSVEIRGMTEEQKIEKCDLCDKPITRLFTAPPVQFKGPGFYSSRR
jgi:putative FmdB family regulatory protein